MPKSRTSRGVRGLKSLFSPVLISRFKSHLSRGAWIEISLLMSPVAAFRSHLSRGAWIEMKNIHATGNHRRSHLSRGAWIEISGETEAKCMEKVAPLAGCVD